MSPMVQKFNVFCLSTFVAVLLLQINIPPIQAETFDKALELHTIAREGNKDHVDKNLTTEALASAIEILEKLETVEPVDPRVIALLGSCYSIAARDLNSWNVIKRRSDINRGLDYIDRALELDGDDVVVRLIRTAVQLHVPETRLAPKTLGRNAAALEEMVKLDELFKEEPLPAIADDMLILYRRMKEKLPERDWSEGIKIAQNLAQ